MMGTSNARGVNISICVSLKPVADPVFVIEVVVVIISAWFGFALLAMSIGICHQGRCGSGSQTGCMAGYDNETLDRKEPECSRTQQITALTRTRCGARCAKPIRCRDSSWWMTKPISVARCAAQP